MALALTDGLLTIRQAAAYLGVCERTVRNFARDGLQSVAISRRCVRFRKRDLARWVLAHQSPPICVPGVDLVDAGAPVDALVYFASSDLFVKIGYTTDLPRRLDKMRTATPYGIDLLGVLRGGATLERRLHAAFASLRHHREWFRLVDPLKAFIDCNAMSPEEAKWGDR